MIMKPWQIVIATTVLFLSGCTHVGPKTVTRDRFDYNTAISNSWKEQTLLNIVKIRYLDMPLFVDISSIVSGYTISSSVDLGGQLMSESALQGDFASLGASGTFTDRPTITYQPITGQKFNKSIMTPIPPSVILFLTQSGWPADLIYPITVDSINGLRGRVSGGVNARPGDPEFIHLVKLFRKIQQSGAVGMRVIKGKEHEETTIMYFHKENTPGEIQDALQEVRVLLGLESEVQEFKVEYGLIQKNDTEIAILTRSMMQIMAEMASQITVPQEHITKGWTLPKKFGDNDENYIIRVNSSRDKPDNAFVAARYLDYWFYIDHDDLPSKMTFTFLMILFSVTESGGKEGLPLVTIPTG
jgi:hypothetical protein